MGSLLDFLKFKITFKEVVPVQPKKKKKRRPSIISSSTNPNEPLPPGPSQKRAKTKSADVCTLKPVAVTHPKDNPRISPVTHQAPSGRMPMDKPSAVSPPPIDPTELVPTVAGAPVNLLENMTSALSSRGLTLQLGQSDELIHPAFRGPLTATQSQLLKELEELEAPEMPEPISVSPCQALIRSNSRKVTGGMRRNPKDLLSHLV
ncbi:hypothetical protein Pst134EB_019847 [Puccinia striiformis f. sp. tritici]|nr:hypothetical protein Pst134EB_019847 [Puccinia striiformis f. sp. tritici]